MTPEPALPGIDSMCVESRRANGAARGAPRLPAFQASLFFLAGSPIAGSVTLGAPISTLPA